MERLGLDSLPEDEREQLGQSLDARQLTDDQRDFNNMGSMDRSFIDRLQNIITLRRRGGQTLGQAIAVDLSDLVLICGAHFMGEIEKDPKLTEVFHELHQLATKAGGDDGKA